MTIDGVALPFSIDIPAEWNAAVAPSRSAPRMLQRLVVVSPEASGRTALIVQHSAPGRRAPDPDVELAALDRLLVREEGATDIRTEGPYDGKLGPLPARTRSASYTARSAAVAEITTLAVLDGNLFSVTAMGPAADRSRILEVHRAALASFRPAS